MLVGFLLYFVVFLPGEATFADGVGKRDSKRMLDLEEVAEPTDWLTADFSICFFSFDNKVPETHRFSTFM